MEDNLKIAVDVMAQYIGSRDTKKYTKETLMQAYGFDAQLADELTQDAWSEWLDAYTD